MNFWIPFENNQEELEVRVVKVKTRYSDTSLHEGIQEYYKLKGEKS